MGEPVQSWSLLAKKVLIWGLFLAAVYLASNFFLLIFLTFMLCYVTLGLVGVCMSRLAGNRERPWLRRGLTVAILLMIPVIAVSGLVLLGSRLIGQAQNVSGWLGHADPEAELTRLLEGVVGPAEFTREYGGPDDPRYQQALAEFRESGERYVAEYLSFPAMEARVEGGFQKRFDDDERARLRARFAREGTSSKAFAEWFVTHKYPQLSEQARKDLADKGRVGAITDPIVRGAATDGPDQLLGAVRRDPASLARLRTEWTQEEVEKGLTAARATPGYAEQFRRYYEERRAAQPKALPYPYEVYAELKKARPEGKPAFAAVLQKREGEGGRPRSPAARRFRGGPAA